MSSFLFRRISTSSLLSRHHGILTKSNSFFTSSKVVGDVTTTTTTPSQKQQLQQQQQITKSMSVFNNHHYRTLSSTTTNGGSGDGVGGGAVGGFSFAGPKKLQDIMKTDLLRGKTNKEVSDIWMTYHEDKEDVCGMTLNGNEGIKILERAEKWPFFIQPIFRENGFFMLISQYQEPSHFLLAYLEDYKMDPNRANPLLTFSIFNDLHDNDDDDNDNDDTKKEEKGGDDDMDLSFVRCDVINKGITEKEGKLIMSNMIDSYRIEEDFSRVKVFNDDPSNFDIDDFISCMNQKWKEGSSNDGTSGDDDGATEKEEKEEEEENAKKD